MDNVNIPKYLYRGVKIDYNNIDSYEFTGTDLSVNYEPIMDEYGRRTVQDGNEYGVYMSDNLQMVKSVYGDLHGHGIPVMKGATISNIDIKIPSVAVIYKINTDGLEVRHPFITRALKGHYNNGFQGDEWICDVVPKENYTLYRVRIGSDFLHDAEDISLENINDIKSIVKKKLDERKHRLEIFASAIENIPLYKRNWYGHKEKKIFKIIYGKNGLKYINEDSLATDTIYGMIKYLLAKVFKSNEEAIDLNTIEYIYDLNGKVNSVDEIIDKLEHERAGIIKKRNELSNTHNTIKMDSQILKLERLILLAKKRRIIDNKYSLEKNHSYEHKENIESRRMF